MKLDLHIHSTASDGAWGPTEVVEAAAKAGLDVIALADHDTMAGVAAATAAAVGAGVTVIPAVEMSSSHEGRDVHVLGYFVDAEAPSMRRHAERAGSRRDERMREMVDRLVSDGIEMTFEAVERAAGPDRVNIGRPHLARALVEAGHVGSVPEAFETLIGDDADAFVPTDLLDPTGAVETILAAGGVPVWAHPPADMIDPLLPSLIEAGLRGLEVFRPRSRRSAIERLRSICRARDLLMSGGSDWHNPESGSALGEFWVTDADVAALLEAGGVDRA